MKITKENSQFFDKNGVFLPESYFISEAYRPNVRFYAINFALLPYSCSICAQPPSHNNKKLTLQLDHIDGNKLNNVLDNLRFLCPNCHSQTETYCSRNIKKTDANTCLDCEKILKRSSQRCMDCHKVFLKTRKKDKPQKIILDSETVLKFNILKSELEFLLKEMSLAHIGRLYGVSGRTVKNRALKLGIQFKTRKGYWKNINLG